MAVLLVAALSDIGCTTLGKSGLNPTETMILSTYPLASRRAFGTGFLVAMKDKRARGGVVPVMVTSTQGGREFHSMSSIPGWTWLPSGCDFRSACRCRFS